MLSMGAVDRGLPDSPPDSGSEPYSPTNADHSIDHNHAGLSYSKYSSHNNAGLNYIRYTTNLSNLFSLWAHLQ